MTKISGINLLDSKIRQQKLLNRLETQKTEKLSVQTALRKQISMQSRERSKRLKLLDDIRKKRSLKLAALESLKEAAADLDQAIKSLNSESGLTGPKKRYFIKRLFLFKRIAKYAGKR